jgi:hypothetical protein
VISPPSPENTPKKIEKNRVGFYAKMAEEQKEIFRKTKYENKSKMIRQHLISMNIRPIRSRMLRRWNWLSSKKEVRIRLEEGKLLANRFGLGEPIVCGYSDRKNSPKFDVPEFVTEDIARMMGFAIAAGKVYYHNKNKTSGHIRIKDSKNKMQDYIDIAVRSFGRKADAKSPLKITAVDSVIILESIGLTHTHEKVDKRRFRFPDWIWRERIEIRKAFALGFIEGMGRVRKFKGEWFCYFTTTEAKILSDIKTLWESCGLACGKIHRKRKIKRIRVCKYFYRRRKVNNGFGMIFSKRPLAKSEKVISIQHRQIRDTFDISLKHTIPT